MSWREIPPATALVGITESTFNRILRYIILLAVTWICTRWIFQSIHALRLVKSSIGIKEMQRMKPKGLKPPTDSALLLFSPPFDLILLLAVEKHEINIYGWKSIRRRCETSSLISHHYECRSGVLRAVTESNYRRSDREKKMCMQIE